MFWASYVTRGGILDGKMGYRLSLLAAWYQWKSEQSLMEAQTGPRTQESPGE
jgi:hypothetical protein